MLTTTELERLKAIAKGVAAQFGSGCEVVIHEISPQSTEHSIAAIENGHVTGRSVGDGPSRVVLEQLGKKIDTARAEDRYGYLTRTPDGKVLKSSTVYLRDDKGEVAALFCINFDISALSVANASLGSLIAVGDAAQAEPVQITNNVNDLLEKLLERSVQLVGKPVELMTKDDKVRAIRFLSDSGALLITRSGDRIAKFFRISKYTLYSYLDMKQEEKNT